MDRMKILVTGLIGSGKSAVCNYLATLGYPVYDSDTRTKSLYESVPGLKEQIEQTLGVPFSELGIIFRDEQKRLALEELVYPLVLEDFRRFAESAASEVVIFESAVALDKVQFAGVFDKVVLVRAPYETRLRRNPKAGERSAVQNEPDPAAVDFIIDNDSGLAELHDRVDRLLKQLKI